jgi:hypothetical protein
VPWSSLRAEFAERTPEKNASAEPGTKHGIEAARLHASPFQALPSTDTESQSFPWSRMMRVSVLCVIVRHVARGMLYFLLRLSATSSYRSFRGIFLAAAIRFKSSYSGVD